VYPLIFIMVNVLLEGYDIDAPWLFEELRPYISPRSKVAVIAFSFRDSRVKNLEDWNVLYASATGRFYNGIVRAFEAYGILEQDIFFLNYFTDTKESAADKIRQANILYFLGGLPDKMMERIEEFDLRDALIDHKGVIMGYSAGAVIQLSEYHLSPDEDYPHFQYHKGLPYLDNFYLEVHYEGTEPQKSAIEQVLTDRKKIVYATSLMRGALIVDNGTVKTVGDVKIFSPEKTRPTLR